VHLLSISVGDGMKMLISGGAVTPPSKRRQRRGSRNGKRNQKRPNEQKNRAFNAPSKSPPKKKSSFDTRQKDRQGKSVRS